MGDDERGAGVWAPWLRAACVPAHRRWRLRQRIPHAFAALRPRRRGLATPPLVRRACQPAGRLTGRHEPPPPRRRAACTRPPPVNPRGLTLLLHAREALRQVSHAIRGARRVKLKRNVRLALLLRLRDQVDDLGHRGAARRRSRARVCGGGSRDGVAPHFSRAVSGEIWRGCTTAPFALSFHVALRCGAVAPVSALAPACTATAACLLGGGLPLPSTRGGGRGMPSLYSPPWASRCM